MGVATMTPSALKVVRKASPYERVELGHAAERALGDDRVVQHLGVELGRSGLPAAVEVHPQLHAGRHRGLAGEHEVERRVHLALRDLGHEAQARPCSRPGWGVAPLEQVGRVDEGPVAAQDHAPGRRRGRWPPRRGGPPPPSAAGTARRRRPSRWPPPRTSSGRCRPDGARSRAGIPSAAIYIVPAPWTCSTTPLDRDDAVEAARRSGCARAGSRSSSARSTCSGRGQRAAARHRGRPGPLLILWGPPGTGKTTLARIIAERTGAAFVAFSAVLGGREGHPRDRGRGPGAQAAAPPADHPLRRRDPPLQPRPAGRVPAPRRGGDHHARSGATTENPSFEVNAALLSRCRVVTLAPLTEEEVGALLDRARRLAARAGREGPARARGPRGASRAPPTATRGGRSRRWRSAAAAVRLAGREEIDARRRRGGAAAQDAALRQGRRGALQRRLAPSSSRCAARIPTPPSTTWCGCWRAARSRASCCGAW